MKVLQIICVGGIMLLVFSTRVKAQSSAGFAVSATIVNPIGLRSESSPAYTDVAAKAGEGKNNVYEITVADFKLDAATEDVYSITVPGEMALRNKQGSSCITAVVNPLVAAQQLPNGQKRFTVDSEIILGNDQAQGKHSSTPFEVTVNFN